MAGVLERITPSWKRVIEQKAPLDASPPKVLQLQMAKKILAETFGISIREVEEMIQMRCEERGSWPESLWIDGWDSA